MREAPFALSKPWLLAALLLAAGLHIGVAALLFWVPSSTEGQAIAAGTGGIEISLGPAGRSQDGPENRKGEEKPAPIEEPELPQEQPKPQPTAPQPKPEPQPQAVATVAKLKPLVEPLAPQPQAILAGNAGKTGNTEYNNTGTGDNTAGGGIPGSTQDYAATLLAWLERHKEYPRSARIRRHQGRVLLYFVINHGGKVLSQRIEQSSGYNKLDEAALAMLERARPLPAMPDSIDKETLELVVPIEFFLR